MHYGLTAAVGLVSTITPLMAQQKVLLDHYFNREFNKTADGQLVPFHYTWTDTAQTGYSQWGQVFAARGCVPATLDRKPKQADLRDAAVYIIVDPDTERETQQPNYMDQESASAILAWVNKGGVLVVMGNDSINAEQQHINNLIGPSGIRMAGDSRSPVLNGNFDMGAFYPPKGDPVFKTARKLYLKEVSTLLVQPPAKPFLVHQTEGYTVGAWAPYGKGTVIVVGDPWLYNEYVNGILPPGFDNDKAMAELTTWILSFTKAGR